MQSSYISYIDPVSPATTFTHSPHTQNIARIIEVSRKRSSQAIKVEFECMYAHAAWVRQFKGHAVNIVYTSALARATMFDVVQSSSTVSHRVQLCGGSYRKRSTLLLVCRPQLCEYKYWRSAKLSAVNYTKHTTKPNRKLLQEKRN